MPEQKKEPSALKVTDKRMFTSEGDLKDEFIGEIEPAANPTERKAEPAPAAPEPQRPASKKPSEPAGNAGSQRSREQRGENPGTPFTMFLEGIIVQAYSMLGLLPDPYGRQRQPDQAAARQMIDLIAMLDEKTRGNLSETEMEFLETHLGELRLAYVQQTKTI